MSGTEDAALTPPELTEEERTTLREACAWFDELVQADGRSYGPGDDREGSVYLAARRALERLSGLLTDWGVAHERLDHDDYAWVDAEQGEGEDA